MQYEDAIAATPKHQSLSHCFKGQANTFPAGRIPIALDAQWAQAFMNLSGKVRNALPEHEKHYLKKRTLKDLHMHVSARMPLIGVTRKKTLIAGALVTYPDRDEAINIHDYPLKDHDLSTTAIIQSVMTDPDYAGYGLGNRVLESAEMLALTAGQNYLMAKIAETNNSSQRIFEKGGFKKVETVMDPKGYLAGFWTKKIGGLYAK